MGFTTRIVIGQKIGSYVLREEIGQGGMAIVYRAHQPSMNRDVALKLIRLDKTAMHSDFRERFAKEAEVIAALEHIHILPVYDYGIDGDVAYLAMRYLRGGSLRDLVEAGPIDLERASGLFTQVARGLAYAHKRGVIHRDLKPGNILLDDINNAYLSDFGLARWGEPISTISPTSTVMGTITYMSPEALMGAEIDNRSDIYSLGVMLYDMLTGQPPFDADASGGIASLVVQHLQTAPKPPSAVNPALPPAIDAVVMRALQKKADERYESAEHMAADFDKALSGTLNVGSAAVPTTQPGTSRRRELPPLAIIALISVLVGLATLGLLMATSSDSQPRFRPPTIVEGQSGNATDLKPSDVEILTAQRQLGRDGFIAYLTCNQTSEYHATQAREVSQFAEEADLSVRVYDSDSDAYRQITQLERARADGAGGFIICLLDAKLEDQALESLSLTGVPIVFFNPDEKLYGGIGIGQDERLLGQAAGRYAGELITDELDGEADVVILDYPSLPIIVQRADGIEAGLRDAAPNAHVIGRYPGGTLANGKQSVNTLLADGIHFDVIVSINDAGSFGAISTLELAGIDERSVIIVSIDAEVQALDYIRDGHYLRASVPVDREGFSRAAVNAMIRMLAGGTLPERAELSPGEIITLANLP
jgi:serine/threonine protein kinase/DNA-binding LacI/PurR family transcriptional regulator